MSIISETPLIKGGGDRGQPLHDARPCVRSVVDATRGFGAFAACQLPDGRTLAQLKPLEVIRMGEKIGAAVSHEQGYAHNVAAVHDFLVASAMKSVEKTIAKLFSTKDGV